MSPSSDPDRLTRIKLAVEVLGEVSRLAVFLRRRPSPLDLLAMGVAGAASAIRIYQEHYRKDLLNPWMYFSESSEWLPLPRAIADVVVQNAAEIRLVQPGPHGVGAVAGRLGNAEVGWVARANETAAAVSGVAYAKATSYSAALAAVGEIVWARVPSGQARYTPSEIRDDTLRLRACVDSRAIRELRDRVATFLPAVPRGYLLVGPPGSGKTTAARAVAAGLGLRSLRVDAGDVEPGRPDRPADEARVKGATPIDAVVEVLRPDVVILDDMDRLGPDTQGLLLGVVERLRSAARVVIATANDYSHVVGPMTRPGRFDDVLTTAGLEAEAVAAILDEADHDLVERLTGWPIAFVVDYRARASVLGREARNELDELERRAKAALKGAPARR